MGRAWIVLAASPAASPATKHYNRFREERYAGLFVMDCFTREESRALRSVFIATILFWLAYSHSIIYGLDAEHFVEYFEKWGPSVRTCLRLAWGTTTEEELEYDVGKVTKKLAEDTFRIMMGANSEVGYHSVFATLPNSPKRASFTLRVATPHIRHFVMQAIASLDAAKQVSFYDKVSTEQPSVSLRRIE
jgi:hypothetical protein